jgi:methionyl-tRNA synthetase
MAKLEFAKAIETFMAIADQTNKYVNDEAPWKQFKEG